MKGVRFYLEYATKAAAHKATVKEPGEHKGTVVAVSTEGGYFGYAGTYCYEAVAAVYDRPNAPVATTAVAREYLDEQCKRIPEALARSIHPVLFEFLDQEESK